MSVTEDRVRGLLEWYPAVVEGWRGDGAGTETSGPASVSAWHHPSYRTLESLRLELRTSDRRVYWHVDRRFINVEVRRVVGCPACDVFVNAAHNPAGMFHRHGGKRVYFQYLPRAVVSPLVRPEVVTEGVRWIARGFARAGVEPMDIQALVNRERRAA